MHAKNITEQILFESNYTSVYRAVCLYYGNNNVVVIEDAVQEAFLKAFSNLSKLQKRGSFAAWVTTIAINILKDEASRHNKVTLISIDELIDKLEYLQNEYEAIETKEIVLQLLKVLDDNQRIVVILHYMFDLPLSQISELHNISTGTLKSRLFRAREKMRNLYQGGAHR